MLVVLKLSFWVSLLFTCRPIDPEISVKIIDSVEYQESRSKIFVRSTKCCHGLMQIHELYSPVPKPLLHVPFINRIAGVKALRYWKRRSRNNMTYALAAYNCGNKGLYGECGMGYANSVLSRNLRYKRYFIPECSFLSQILKLYIER